MDVAKLMRSLNLLLYVVSVLFSSFSIIPSSSSFFGAPHMMFNNETMTMIMVNATAKPSTVTMVLDCDTDSTPTGALRVGVPEAR